MKPTDLSLVSTIREKCRARFNLRCRECPAKAIRIAGGQAEVIPSRCIGCGSCGLAVQPGSQARAQFSREAVHGLLRSGARVVRALRPVSRPRLGARETGQMVGALRKLGFSLVCAGGVRRRPGGPCLSRGFSSCPAPRGESFIATACPAIVNFVERYHPELIPHLAPITSASPMLATARGSPCPRATRRRHEDCVHWGVHREEGRGGHPVGSRIALTPC